MKNVKGQHKKFLVLLTFKEMKILKMKGPMSLGIELTSGFLARTDLQEEQRLQIQLERVTCLRISGRVQEARDEMKIALRLVDKVDKTS